MDFISKHWQGNYSLAISFWLIFLALTASYHLLEPYILNVYIGTPSLFIITTVAYLLVSRLIIYPWQIIGLLRSADRHYKSSRRSMILYTVQALVVASIIGTFGHAVTVVQGLFFYKENTDFYAVEKVELYTLEITHDGKVLQLRGTLDFGVTEATQILLTNNPDISAIVLESDGGQIYEGRGMAINIAQYGLDVYTFELCASACTTAFMGGSKRYLGENAKLGFHQYGLDPTRYREINQHNSLEQEQIKDRVFFESKNIDQAFIDQAFTTPHNEMWFPAASELIAAGVVDSIVTELNRFTDTATDSIE